MAAEEGGKMCDTCDTVLSDASEGVVGTGGAEVDVEETKKEMDGQCGGVLQARPMQPATTTSEHPLPVDARNDNEGESNHSGASKRPTSVVLAELSSAGLVDLTRLWAQIDRIAALTLIAIQPELANAYRQRVPRRPSANGGLWGGGPFISSSSSSSSSASSAPSSSSLPNEQKIGADGASAASAVGEGKDEASNGGGGESADGGGTSGNGDCSGAESPLADHHRCFQVIGMDILLDKSGTPRLLEINAKPSLEISQERVEIGPAADDGGYEAAGWIVDELAKPKLKPRSGGGGGGGGNGSGVGNSSSAGMSIAGPRLIMVKEQSPVDVMVKQRILTDMLKIVGETPLGEDVDPANMPKDLCCVVGGTSGPPPEPYMLPSKLARVFETALAMSATRSSSNNGTTGSGTSTMLARATAAATQQGLSCPQFLRFARATGMCELPNSPSSVTATQAELEVRFTRVMVQQMESEMASQGGFSPLSPSSRHINRTSFCRIIAELAEARFPELRGTAARVNALLVHLASALAGEVDTRRNVGSAVISRGGDGAGGRDGGGGGGGSDCSGGARVESDEEEGGKRREGAS